MVAPDVSGFPSPFAYATRPCDWVHHVDLQSKPLNFSKAALTPENKAVLSRLGEHIRDKDRERYAKVQTRQARYGQAHAECVARTTLMQPASLTDDEWGVLERDDRASFVAHELCEVRLRNFATSHPLKRPYSPPRFADPMAQGHQ